MIMKWAAVMAVMGRLRNMTPLERWFFVVSSDDHITVVAVVAMAQGTLCGKVRRSVGDSGCVLLLRVLLLQLLLLFKVQWWRCTLEDKRRQEAMSQNNNNDLLIRLQEMERAQLIATLCEQFNLGLLHGSGFCVRSSTSATRAAVEAFEALDKNGAGGGGQMRSFLRDCSDKHFKLVKEASMGKGFDRHFFGLRLAAERLGLEPHPLFTHPVYESMNHFVLSTSTLSTDTIYFGGFGPVVPDGIGIGYNVTDTKLGAVAIAYNGNRSAKEFTKALDVSLDKIRRIIGLHEN
uniref:Carn_acyltransf domain-containing protein n=1 Tax=Globodera pallida TaxID=36090 RepID=A0A183CGY7_GLOPA